MYMPLGLGLGLGLGLAHRDSLRLGLGLDGIRNDCDLVFPMITTLLRSRHGLLQPQL